LDGYRVARERLIAQHPELRFLPDDNGNEVSVVNAANPGSLRPAFAMSFFAVFGAAMFIAYAALIALNGHAVRSRGSLEQGPTGLVFSDRREGIELTVPEGWSPFRSEDTLVSLRADGMSPHSPGAVCNLPRRHHVESHREGRPASPSLRSVYSCHDQT
jgi:hypothetical protein